MLTPDQTQDDNSEFRLFLQRPITLNPLFEWEVGVLDTTIELSSANTHEEYCFRYLVQVAGDDVAFAYEINSVTKKKDLYCNYSPQRYPQMLSFNVSDDHMIRKVIGEVATRNEAILIQMPEDQFKDVFGGDDKY